MFFFCSDGLRTKRRYRSPVTLFSSIRVRPPLAAPITVRLRYATWFPRAAPHAHKCSGSPGPFDIWFRTVNLSSQLIWCTPHLNPTCQLSRCSSGLPMLTQAPLALSGQSPWLGPHASLTTVLSCLQNWVWCLRRTLSSTAHHHRQQCCPRFAAAGWHSIPALKSSHKAVSWLQVHQLRLRLLTPGHSTLPCAAHQSRSNDHLRRPCHQLR
jgi:hypothetical protein